MKQNRTSSSFASAKKNISETLSWWHQRAQLMPNWSDFRYELPNAFLFNYLFAFAFLIIACISLLAMRTIRPHLALRRSLVTLNLFIFLMASVRAFCLFIDPYGSHQVISTPLSNAFCNIFSTIYKLRFSRYSLINVS